MREALADVDARMDDLRVERDRLVASIDEVEGRPPSHEDAGMPMSSHANEREPLLPVTSPRVENALVGIMRDVGFSEAQIATRFPDRPEPAMPDEGGYDPADDVEFRTHVQAYSNRLPDGHGLPRIDLLRTPEDDGGRSPPRRPTEPGETPVAVVTLSPDGRLVVSAPGTPPTRIVALRAKRACAAAQRVAELVEDALQARDRQER